MLNLEKQKERITYLEKTILPLVKKLIEQGKSQYYIANQLNEKGLFQGTGRHWQQYGISRLIRANSQ